MVDSVSVRFKNARVSKKMPLNIIVFTVECGNRLRVEVRAKFGKVKMGLSKSETGRIRFRGVRFQTPNSVSFSGLTEFRGANSASSSQPIICV